MNDPKREREVLRHLLASCYFFPLFFRLFRLLFSSSSFFFFFFLLFQKREEGQKKTNRKLLGHFRFPSCWLWWFMSLVRKGRSRSLVSSSRRNVGTRRKQEKFLAITRQPRRRRRPVRLITPKRRLWLAHLANVCVLVFFLISLGNSLVADFSIGLPEIERQRDASRSSFKRPTDIDCIVNPK